MSEARLEGSQFPQSDPLARARADCLTNNHFAGPPKPYTVELRLGMARVLGGAQAGRVRVISAGNALMASRKGLPEDDRVAYSVHVGAGGQFRTIALDFDSKLDSAERVEGEAAWVLRLLRRGGIPAVLVSSGPTGGRHVLATVTGPKGLVSKWVRRLGERLRYAGLMTLDLSPLSSAGSSTIRPPGSPHRVSGYSRVIGDPCDALADLQLGADAGLWETFIRALPYQSGPKQPLQVAGERHVLGEARSSDGRKDKSGSGDLQALATKFANDNASYEDFSAAAWAFDVDHPISATLARRGKRAEAALKRAWRAAVEFVAAKPAVGGSRLGDARTLHEWRGYLPAAMLSPTAKRMAGVMLDLAEQHERNVVGLDVRSASEKAGVSPATAARALNVLLDHDLLDLVGDFRGVEGRRFRLLPVSRWRAVLPETVSPSFSSGGVGSLTVSSRTALEWARDVTSDVWSAGGLGDRGRLVYEQLAEADGDPVTVTAIALRQGVGNNRARAVLRDLGRVGLARKAAESEWVFEVREEEEVLSRLPETVAGTASRRADRNNRNRLAYRERVILKRLEDAGARPCPPWIEYATTEVPTTATATTVAC